MDAKWFKHYTGMSTDDKFRKIYRRHKEKFGWINWMWGIVLESAAKDGGWFRQSQDVAHDEESLIVAFEWAYDVYGQEIIDLFMTEYVKEALITKDLLGFVYVTNWEKYQHAALSTGRVREHRESKQLETDVTDVIHELNKVTGKTYRSTTDSHRKNIRARFADGYTKEDMYAVIRYKQADWGNDPKFSKFVTPETLFRPGNFDRYLNEITPEKREAIGTGTILKCENIYGKVVSITQAEFDGAEKGFFKIVK